LPLGVAVMPDTDLENGKSRPMHDLSYASLTEQKQKREVKER
jgi:hypothetical protein